MGPVLPKVGVEEAIKVLEEPLVFVVLAKLEVLEVKEELDVVLLITTDPCDEDVDDEDTGDDDELVMPVVELD